MQELTYFNGEFVEPDAKVISIDDRGYLFGDSVYEVVRVVKGRCFALSYHQDRLYRSMREMDIPVKMTPDDLTELHEILIEQSEIKEGYIYLQISRGVAPRRHAYDRSKLEPQMLMSIRTLNLDEVNKLGEGVKAIALPDERWDKVDIKTTNLIPNILAQQKQKEICLYCHVIPRWHLYEGATSNVFAVKDGILYTHPADNHILKGITRQMIVTRVAPSLGITLIEKEFDRAFVDDADELFFTDTIGGVIPIIKLDKNSVSGGKPGHVTLRLREALEKLMEEGLP